MTASALHPWGSTKHPKHISESRPKLKVIFSRKAKFSLHLTTSSAFRINLSVLFRILLNNKRTHWSLERGWVRLTPPNPAKDGVNGWSSPISAHICYRGCSKWIHALNIEGQCHIHDSYKCRVNSCLEIFFLSSCDGFLDCWKFYVTFCCYEFPGIKTPRLSVRADTVEGVYRTLNSSCLQKQC